MTRLAPRLDTVQGKRTGLLPGGRLIRGQIHRVSNLVIDKQVAQEKLQKDVK